MIEQGLCQCGCGQKTNIAPQTVHSLGYVRGIPRRFIGGHNGYRTKPILYAVDESTGCWNWALGRGPDGYGSTRRKNDAGVYISQNAHRYMYKKLRGEIPEGLQLDHLCRNHLCVNPDHLRAVTHQVNTQCGDVAKLLPEQVLWMRQKYKEGISYGGLAREFGITTGTASMAVRGITWGNL